MNVNEWSASMEETRVKTEVGNLPPEAKIAVAIRLAEVIEECKDPDVISGLKSLFKTLVADMISVKVEQRH